MANMLVGVKSFSTAHNGLPCLQCAPGPSEPRCSGFNNSNQIIKQSSYPKKPKAIYHHDPVLLRSQINHSSLNISSLATARQLVG